MSQVNDKKPGISLLLIAGYVISGLVIFQAVSLGLVSVIYGIPLMEMTEFIEDPTSVENGKSAMLLIQGFTAFGTFILDCSRLDYAFKSSESCRKHIRHN